MKHSRVLLFLLVSLPLVCFGQKKEIMELQRDMALLQDQVRSMQRSIDENMAALKVLAQQSLDGIAKLNTSMAVLERSVGDRLREQEKSLVNPVATVGSKVDQMASEFQAVRDSMADLNSRMGKLEQRILDLGNTIKVLQSPPAPPPPAGGATTSGPPAGVSSASLYASAMRDKDSRSYDLALQEFQEYLRYFGSTETAPNAQYYIGEIYYNQQDYDGALKAFDLVLEKYPENTKTLDAMYMKGQTLLRMGERTKAAAEFQEVHRRAPSSEMAAKARARLKELGLSVSSPARRKKTK